ncbi:hypothetical protein FF38_14057 [Lucilia cuprina]|uniref:Uncharacterized protein n=1 Tax=Lucilia cuprina TaxID=7375 RepID=A0A0L0BWH6_LUCCU|nr:hypothetical protein FF38_14057 [Lucilia cuprina]
MLAKSILPNFPSTDIHTPLATTNYCTVNVLIPNYNCRVSPTIQENTHTTRQPPDVTTRRIRLLHKCKSRIQVVHRLPEFANARWHHFNVLRSSSPPTNCKPDNPSNACNDQLTSIRAAGHTMASLSATPANLVLKTAVSHHMVKAKAARPRSNNSCIASSQPSKTTLTTPQVVFHGADTKRTDLLNS